MSNPFFGRWDDENEAPGAKPSASPYAIPPTMSEERWQRRLAALDAREDRKKLKRLVDKFYRAFLPTVRRTLQGDLHCVVCCAVLPLDATGADRRCPTCVKGEKKVGSRKFCRSCGDDLEPKAVLPDGTKKFGGKANCPSCQGTSLPLGQEAQRIALEAARVAAARVYEFKKEDS